MSLDCGSQVVLCDVPIRFDTYKGCSHACRYCFVKRNSDITRIEKDNCIKQLENFIAGKRIAELKWCDWNIPLHWGGMSDPFQPIEKKHRLSYEALKVFARTKYPVIISTKGKLVAEQEYLDLLSKCNAVLQISMVCSKYDKIELGAPTYEERLKICKKVSPYVKRLIVRIQPYMTEVHKDIIENIPRLAEAGVYGIVVEGMKFVKKRKGLIRLGADYVYPKEMLQERFEAIKKKCHEYGLKFYCGENRLRSMGDAMCCCGIDGLEGFRGNEYNLCHILNGLKPEPTDNMKSVGTAKVFNSLIQQAGYSKFIKEYNFADLMESFSKNKTYIKVIKGE